MIDSTTKLKALPVQMIETEQGVILKRGGMETRIKGEGAAVAVHTILRALIHQPLTCDEICQRTAAPDREAMEHLAQQLIERRILVPGESQDDDEARESNLEIFYWHFREQTKQVNERLNDRSLTILGVNHISRQLVSSLAMAGVDNFQIVDYPLLRNLRLFDKTATLMSSHWPGTARAPTEFGKWADGLADNRPGCLIVTSDFNCREVLRDWNRICVKLHIDLLPVVLHDLIGHVGPLVVPGETACFECLYARQNSHLSDLNARRALDEVAFESQVVNGFHPSMASMLADIALLELTKFYGGLPSIGRIGTLIEADFLTMEMHTHKPLKIPRCPVCSSLLQRSSMNYRKPSL